MKWFKFYGQDYLSDPKMLALSACERSCWITLLSYASVNDDGTVSFFSEDQLMSQAGLDFQNEHWDRTRGVLEKFKKLGMIKIDDKKIEILNWKKRQDSYLTGAERVKRFREKKKRNVNVTDKGYDVNARREENRIDKKIHNTTSALADDTFASFWSAFPKKENKKKSLDIWKRKKLGVFLPQILAFIEKAKETDRWRGGFIPHPTTFLNSERWNDDLSGYSDFKKEQGLTKTKY